MSNTFWRDAAGGGIIIGAIAVAVSYMKVWFAPEGTTAASMLSVAELVAIVCCLYRFGRRRAMLADPAGGYTYGQNMGFVMGLMLLAGFIYGLGFYFLYNFLAPGMAETISEASVEAAGRMYGNMGEGMEAMARKMIASPLFWVFYGILAMILYGGIVGLFVSAFVKRKPQYNG